MQQWEYLVIGGLYGQMESQLNELGAEGWELVTVGYAFNSDIGVLQQVEFIFKRPKRS